MHLLEAIEKFSNYREVKEYNNKTVQGDDLNLRYFAAFMRDKRIQDVTLDEIVEFIGWMKKIRLHSNTVLKKSVSLRKFFEYYKNNGFPVVNHNLIPLWKKEGTIPRVADASDYETVLNAIPDNSPFFWHLRNKAFILVQGGCGARIGEVCRIQISNLDADLGGAIIATEKSRGRRPFRKVLWDRDPRAVEYVKKWLVEREKLGREIEIEDKDSLFVGCMKNYRGLVPPMKEVAAKTMTEWYRKYSRMAGLPYVVNSHSLRHKFGRDLTKKGAKNSVISSLMGHSSLQSSYIYTELWGEDVQEEYDKYLIG